MTDRVLVGDVGGTNVRFGIAEMHHGRIGIHDFFKMPGDEFDRFEAALQNFAIETGADLASLPAVFALAGPYVKGCISLTNRDWRVCETDLLARFNFPSVTLVNDFTAMARAVPELDEERFELIHPGTAIETAPMIIGGPGTGFGVATLFPRTSRQGWRILSGEGGYMNYAPHTDTEIELAKLLRAAHGYVSNELVCAGIGLMPVHKAMCAIYDRDYVETSPADMLEIAASGDHMFHELISIRARGAMNAMGDLVLANGALGGAVLAGGVSERISVYFKAPEAIARFYERGRNSKFLADCPIHLMHDPAAPLIGAAAILLKDAI